MRLAEEYLQRHGIKEPLIHHGSQGSILLSRPGVPNERRWLLCYFQWVDDPQHPGTYLLNNLYPIHDSFLTGNTLFGARTQAVQLEWDEFEDYFLNTWVDEVAGYSPIMGNSREITLAAWEMFLYCYDAWFVRQSHNLKEIVYQSVDTDLSINDRYVGYQNALIHLTTHFPQVLKSWKYEMLVYFHHYSDWLGKLVT